MKSCFSTFSTFLAGICAFLFVLLASGTLIAFIVYRMLLSPGTYKQALTDQLVYERAPALIAEQLIYQQTSTGEEKGAASQPLDPNLARLTQADWEVMLGEILTPDSLQTQVESVIDQFIHYVNTPGVPLKLKVSLAEFKQKLDGDQGFRAAMQMIEAQPACTSEEWSQIVNGTQSAQLQDIPFCRPPETILNSAEPYIREALHDVVFVIPNETYLDDRSGATSSSNSSTDWREDLQRVRGLVWLSLCIPASLFLLVMIFGVRSLKGFWLWLGLPTLFTGVFTLLAAMVTWSLPGLLVTDKYASRELTLEGVAPGVTQMLVDVGTSITHSAAMTIGILGILLGLLGLGLLAGAFLFGLARRTN